MKMLARNNTRAELEVLLGIKTVEASRAAKQHLAAIDKSTSMSGNSSNRAASRSVVAATGDYKIALVGALEIYDLFPEFTKEFGGKSA